MSLAIGARAPMRTQRLRLPGRALCFVAAIAVLLLVSLAWVLQMSKQRGEAMRQSWTDASTDQETARQAQRRRLAQQQTERALTGR